MRSLQGRFGDQIRVLGGKMTVERPTGYEHDLKLSLNRNGRYILVPLPRIQSCICLPSRFDRKYWWYISSGETRISG
jgi:hypothetical protein